MIDITNWYWIVGGSSTQVFSSASLTYVATNDATYSAWLAAGNMPSSIDTAENLFAIFQGQWMPRQLASGVAFTDSSNASLNGQYALDAISVSSIQRIANGLGAGLNVPGGGTTFNYPDIDGVLHAFGNNEFGAFAEAVTDLMYNYQNALYTIVTGGTAALPPLSISVS